MWDRMEQDLLVTIRRINYPILIDEIQYFFLFLLLPSFRSMRRLNSFLWQIWTQSLTVFMFACKDSDLRRVSFYRNPGE